MDLSEPRFVTLEEVFEGRPGRLERLRARGLWVSGSLAGLKKPAVAVVGCRAPSEAGRRRSHALAEGLAAAGVCVVSGLALGIDGAAHAGALAAGGPTIGVLGGGHWRFFPQRNRALAEAMLAAGGAVVSPFPPDEIVRPWQFLARNGIVAALSDAVVVVEAAARSGALNTAGWAADLAIDVCAFPGEVDRPKAAGCNALIRDGALLVRDAADVLAALGVANAQSSKAGASPQRSSDPLSQMLLDLLREGALDLDELVARSGVAPGALLAALMQLEIAGEVRGEAGTYALV